MILPLEDKSWQVDLKWCMMIVRKKNEEKEQSDELEPSEMP
jgi:hypothetical protein